MLHAGTIAKTPTVVKGSSTIILALLPTAPVVPLQATVESAFSKKSLYILRENVRTLLHARKEEQKTLAEWCGHDKSWMNKFLNEGRGIRIDDFDRIAAFFGIETYQLFQPGISRLTERRMLSDRRQNTERRIGHQGRQFAALRVEHAKLPQVSYAASALSQPVPDAVKRIIARYDREIEAYLARQQAATDGAGRADLSEDHRRVRRPRAKSGG